MQIATAAFVERNVDLLGVCPFVEFYRIVWPLSRKITIELWQVKAHAWNAAGFGLDKHHETWVAQSLIDQQEGEPWQRTIVRGPFDSIARCTKCNPFLRCFGYRIEFCMNSVGREYDNQAYPGHVAIRLRNAICSLLLN